jgi:hypothetical protein
MGYYMHFVGAAISGEVYQKVRDRWLTAFDCCRIRETSCCVASGRPTEKSGRALHLQINADLDDGVEAVQSLISVTAEAGIVTTSALSCTSRIWFASMYSFIPVPDSTSGSGPAIICHFVAVVSGKESGRNNGAKQCRKHALHTVSCPN